MSRRAPFNDVLLLRKGATDQPVTVAKIPGVHGLAINDSKMYLAAVRKVYVAELKSDGTLETPKEIYTDLPDAGQHPNRTLAFSPKGELFLSVGSTCNEAPEPNPESATMLVIQPDGSGRKIFASGLRNTIGFDWNPKTGQLWGMDHGIDWLGDEEQREELNQLVENQKYGWPFIYEDGKPNLNRDPETTEGVTWTEYAKTCVSPVLTMDAHSAPMQFLFCKGTQFPEEYRGDAFLTLHGSWNRKEPTGYKVVRVRFKDGRPQSYEDFLSGFLTRDNQAQFGRPCGLAFLPDGTLLVGDDQNGVIYQVAYVGAK